MRRYFDGAATVDVEQMLDAWNDDLVYEEAFSDPPRRIDGKDARGEFPYEHMIRKFKVTLERRGNKWLIADYSDADSRDGRGR